MLLDDYCEKSLDKLLASGQDTRLPVASKQNIACDQAQPSGGAAS